MKKKIFLGMIFTTLITLLASTLLLSVVFYENTVKEVKNRLQEEGVYIAQALETSDITYLEAIGLTSKNRLTLIDINGTVLYDNFANPLTMENHLDRPEVIQAMASGVGEDSRESETVGEQTFYYAIKLTNNQIFRIAASTKSAFTIFFQAFLWVIPIIILLFVASVLISSQTTKVIINPLLKLNLDNPLSNNTYQEISPLLLRMARQNKKIDDQMREAQAKQEEFNAITANLAEGLMVFDHKKNLLFANNSAKTIFHNTLWEGQSYLKFSRDLDYIRVLEQAFLGNQSTAKVHWDGKVYNILAHFVNGFDDHNAAVLFIIDITDRELSEQRRREFSANVSHELKTPLTSIMGYAEIISNGIAKQADIPRFSQEIYQGAAHLLALIDDIIKLSRLDEGDLKKQFTEVDLFAITKTVINDLQKKAVAKNISINLQATKTNVLGIDKMLYELIYNLCDNAIIYNHDQGQINLSITNDIKQIILTIQDTGIGIAPKDQDRVFERFYRVDQSHSKDTGGTGLGLSIVKHIATLHDAKIELQSKLNVGTTIKIIFKQI